MKTKKKIAATNMVSRIELARIKRDRARLDAMRVEAEALAEDLREREQDVIERMDAGMPVDGEATIVARRRQNISWLSIVKRELGADAVVRVKNEWPVSFSKELLIP